MTQREKHKQQRKLSAKHKIKGLLKKCVIFLGIFWQKCVAERIPCVSPCCDFPSEAHK